MRYGACSVSEKHIITNESSSLMFTHARGGRLDDCQQTMTATSWTKTSVPTAGFGRIERGSYKGFINYYHFVTVLNWGSPFFTRFFFGGIYGEYPGKNGEP